VGGCRAKTRTVTNWLNESELIRSSDSCSGFRQSFKTIRNVTSEFSCIDVGYIEIEGQKLR
jgi:hypothetical protein